MPKSTQLSFFFFSNFGSLLRHPGVGSRKMQWLSPTHLDSPTLSQVCFSNYGLGTGATFELLVKAEASQNNFAESMEYNFVICFGILNPHLSVSVIAPPDVADIKVVAEGSAECCHWSAFQVHFGELTTITRT